MTGSFTPLPTITTISFPALTTIVGTYAPSVMNAATTLNLSLLNTIGGSFTQIQCQQFQQLHT
jgi:hypothetical protein